MKHQQVVVDYWTMFKTSCTCLLLAISGYILMKMVQTIFYLPGYLKNNQKRLEELAAKYNLNLDKEIAEAENEILVEKEIQNENECNNSMQQEADASEDVAEIENEQKKVK